jgi:hypothetical protein
MDAQKFLNDRTDRAIRTLMRGFLETMEDLQSEHDINFAKLRKHLPEQESLIDMADYLDDDRFGHYRKKILDLGNGVLREHQSELENFRVEFKFRQG